MSSRQDTPLYGRCLRPALPMNRALLRGLGLSVGIAIALSGCATTCPPAADPGDDRTPDERGCPYDTRGSAKG
jgi:hypothetical protein